MKSSIFCTHNPLILAQRGHNQRHAIACRIGRAGLEIAEYLAADRARAGLIGVNIRPRKNTPAATAYPVEMRAGSHMTFRTPMPGFVSARKR